MIPKVKQSNISTFNAWTCFWVDHNT